MRDQYQRLEGLLQPFAPNLIEQNRYGDGKDGSQHDERQVIAQRVADDDTGIATSEKKTEILEATESASPYAVGIFKFFERKLQAREGHVVIHKQVQNARQGHDVQRKMAADPFQKRRFLLRGLFHAWSLHPSGKVL